MKKTLLILTCAVLLAGGLTSCKKGENDPFLSLRSRKARVTGKWNLTTSTHYLDDRNSDNDAIIFTQEVADGIRSITVEILEQGTVQPDLTGTTKQEYQTVLEINKDGTFTQTIVVTTIEQQGMTVEGETTTQILSGTWAFVGKSNSGDLKNKEAIALTYLNSSYSSPNENNQMTTTGFSDTQVLIIDQLKNKEMTITRNSSETDNDGSTDVDNYTATYEKE